MLFSAFCSSPPVGGGSGNGGEGGDTQCLLDSNSMPECTEYCAWITSFNFYNKYKAYLPSFCQ